MIKLGIIPALSISEYKYRNRMIWVCMPGDLPYRVKIESHTAAGFHFELQTFLERFVGENLEVCVYESSGEDSKQACDIVRNLIHCRTIMCHGIAVWRNPFARIFSGEVTINFSPPWHVKLTRESAQRGVDPDSYTAGGMSSSSGYWSGKFDRELTIN